jgi:hypothetical protein
MSVEADVCGKECCEAFQIQEGSADFVRLFSFNGDCLGRCGDLQHDANGRTCGCSAGIWVFVTYSGFIKL